MPGLADTAKLLASLDLDSSKFNAGAKSAIGTTQKLESSMDRVGAAAKRGIGNAVAFAKGFALIGAGAAAAGIGTAIKLASDLNETQSKVGVVFGSSAQDVLAWGKASAVGMGMSENAAESAAATYGNLFVSMGLGPKKSADMSTALVKLAGDLASFNNLDPSEVLEKLRAGLTGESEPLKTLGININDQILKQKALELGLIKTSSSAVDLKEKQLKLQEATLKVNEAVKKHGRSSIEVQKALLAQDKAQAALKTNTAKMPTTLDAATKAQAAYALIFEQSATAQGDFSRTSGGLANQQRILKANLENVGATIGAKVLPKVADLVKRLNDLIVANGPAVQAFADMLPAAFDAAAGFALAIPWDSVGSAMQIAGTAAQVIVGAFRAMPPWVQTAVITGWGLNKITGGALGDIVGELGKGLVKGVLGMNAGVVNINAGVVNGGGVPVPTGGGANLLKTVAKFAIPVAIAAVTVEAAKVLTDAITGGEDPKVTTDRAIKEGRFHVSPTVIANVERERIAADADAQQRQHYLDSMAGIDRTFVDQQRSHFADLNGHIDKVTTALAKLDTIHTDIQTQLGVLRTSKDPAAIAASATALVKDVLAGAGGVRSNTNMLEQLKTARSLTAPGSADRKAVDAAIATVTSHIKGEEWIRAQVEGARKIVDSNTPTHKKLDTLDSTVERLLARGDTNAASIITELAAQRNITITINGLKATVTARDVNTGTQTAVRKGSYSKTITANPT